MLESDLEFNSMVNLCNQLKLQTYGNLFGLLTSNVGLDQDTANNLMACLSANAGLTNLDT